MIVDVIETNSICDYCIRQQNYYNGNAFGNVCPMWFRNEVCEDAEDFVGKPLIEVGE